MTNRQYYAGVSRGASPEDLDDFADEFGEEEAGSRIAVISDCLKTEFFCEILWLPPRVPPSFFAQTGGKNEEMLRVIEHRCRLRNAIERRSDRRRDQRLA